MVIHDKDNKIFYTVEDGHKAYLKYEIVDNKVDVLTTQVPKPIEGRGIASMLMKDIYGYMQSESLCFIDDVSCSYASAWLKRHC